MKKNPWTGRCFEAAVEALYQHPSAVLVHGTPLGEAGEVAGIRYAHAWVELGDLLVIDLTMNGGSTMPRSLYYRVNSLLESDVRRYSKTEALAMMAQSQHYGPWHEPALSAA